jgi:hypothetical protein
MKREDLGHARSGTMSPIRHGHSAKYFQPPTSTNRSSDLRPVRLSKVTEKFDWYAEKARIEKAIASQREWNRSISVTRSETPDFVRPRLNTRGTPLGRISSSRRSTPGSLLSRGSQSPLSDIAAVTTKPRTPADKIYGNMDMARKFLGRSKAQSMQLNETQSREMAEMSGSWELAQALFQDTGAGDGSWQHANPRALELLPGVNLVCMRLCCTFYVGFLNVC